MGRHGTRKICAAIALTIAAAPAISQTYPARPVHAVDMQCFHAWHQSGRVRALGITTAKRSPQLPDLPTIAESGVPGFEVTSWYGMCGPAGMPKLIVAKLNTDLVKVLNMPDTQRRFAEQGIDAAPATPEQFAQFIKAEIAKWVNVVKTAGITPE